MAASSLLTLIDDIATLLDDVAILSKTAVKKTAGVLGDDLAVNAEQASGVKAERELPVVWAVAKGSFKNKFIIVPAALAISLIYPPLITVLMVLGGLFLCFEGFEKIAHRYLHNDADLEQKHQDKLNAITDDTVDLVQFEQDKIKGAIRTDFVLSAEIVVITMGTVQSQPFMMQVIVVSSLALAITAVVYGLVAGIVKLDDAGLYLLENAKEGKFARLQRVLGRGLLAFAPKLMKLLTIVGTIAMFLVGGGILVHSFTWLHHQVHHIVEWFTQLFGELSQAIMPILMEGFVGLVAGAILLLTVMTLQTVKAKMIQR